MATLTASVRLLEDHLSLGQQEQGHTLLLDRPKTTGGTELGFNGGHLMLLGWGACFKSNLVAAAAARGVEVRSLSLRLEGDTTETPNRFSALRMFVTLDADASVREKLVTIAGNSCIVSNTLRAATELHIVLVDAEP